MTKTSLIAGVLVTLGLAACGHAPTPELVRARNAYARASSGPAVTAVPSDLHKAEVALNTAEAAFSSDAIDERDLAYVAERKAQLAEVLAKRAEHADKREDAEATLASNKEADRVQTKQELEQAKTNLVSAEQDTENQKKLTAAADERAAESDRRAKAMQVELAKWAAVKEEARGVVITLSGSVLFASNKAALLPEAQNRLLQVATALLETKDRHLDVQGYTDSQGKAALNNDLSQRRADAVRTFLVTNGYPPDLIAAHGAGSSSPVADNGTAEGRANNRRVEIIIAPQTSSR